MLPVLFEIGPLKIHSFGFMLVVAFYSCLYFLSKELKRQKLEPNLATDIVFAAAVGGILGAKLYYIIENIGGVNSMSSFMDLAFSGAGLVFFGGLMGGTLGVSIVLWRRKLSWLKFSDIVAPLLMLGYAIGRIGCFMVGDDYGIPTKLPWGVTFENGLPPTTSYYFENYYPWIDLSGFSSGIIPVHPTQIYELIIGLGIFMFLWNKRRSVKFYGQLFFTYMILAGIERFLIEFIRTNPKYILGMSGAQIIGILLIIFGTILLKYPFKFHDQKVST